MPCDDPEFPDFFSDGLAEQVYYSQYISYSIYTDCTYNIIFLQQECEGNAPVAR